MKEQVDIQQILFITLEQEFASGNIFTDTAMQKVKDLHGRLLSDTKTDNDNETKTDSNSKTRTTMNIAQKYQGLKDALLEAQRENVKAGVPYRTIEMAIDEANYACDETSLDYAANSTQEVKETLLEIYPSFESLFFNEQAQIALLDALYWDVSSENNLTNRRKSVSKILSEYPSLCDNYKILPSAATALGLKPKLENTVTAKVAFAGHGLRIEQAFDGENFNFSVTKLVSDMLDSEQERESLQFLVYRINELEAANSQRTVQDYKELIDELTYLDLEICQMNQTHKVIRKATGGIPIGYLVTNNGNMHSILMVPDFLLLNVFSNE